MTRQQIEYLGDIAHDLHRAIEAERTAQFELAGMIAKRVEERMAFLIDPNSYDDWAWTEPTDSPANKWWVRDQKMRDLGIYPENECRPHIRLTNMS